MTAVIAQRLVRQLCPHCRVAQPANKQELEELGLTEGIELFQAKGCAQCQGTGFKGRLGLFETLWFDENLARLVLRGADEETIEAEAGENLQYMWEDGVEKIKLGLTTLDELRNVANRKFRHEVAA
jgi:type IV pilus assembly protein PilB